MDGKAWQATVRRVTKSQIVCSIFVKDAIGVLVRIALNLQIALTSMDILTILIILPVNEHGISSHLFVSPSISFINVLQFSVYMSFSSMVNFIPRYLILIDPIVNGIVFLISLSYSSLLVCINGTLFCVCLFCILLLY